MDERNVQLFAGSLGARPGSGRGRRPRGRRRGTRPGRPLNSSHHSSSRGSKMFRRTSSSPVIEAAVREALRLVPLDLRVHVAEDAVHVVAGKGVVGALDDRRRCSCRVGYAAMEYVMDAGADGPLFADEATSRSASGRSPGEHLEARRRGDLRARGRAVEWTVGGEAHELRARASRSSSPAGTPVVCRRRCPRRLGARARPGAVERARPARPETPHEHGNRDRGP